jgi:hypothetical protein
MAIILVKGQFLGRIDLGDELEETLATILNDLEQKTRIAHDVAAQLDRFEADLAIPIPVDLSKRVRSIVELDHGHLAIELSLDVLDARHVLLA